MSTDTRSKIPATVITGFLGAGKTSLIRHLLAHAGGRRIALIINEFGDVGVDAEIVRGCGIEGCEEDDVIELANGCICCTVADDFVPTMQRLLARPQRPDHILIETSGLALPKPLVKAFNWPEIRTNVTVDGVIAVIDAEATAAGLFASDPAAVEAARQADPELDHESPLEELFEEQIACADMILLNKADLVDDEGMKAARAAIRPHLRAGARIIECAQGEADPLAVLGIAAGAEDDLASRPSHHDDGGEHDHDDFSSVVVEFGPIADPVKAAGAIASLCAAHGALRVKGFLAVEGKPMRLALQGVGARIGHYFDRPWRPEEARRSQLVLIGLSDELDAAAFEKGLAGLAAG